MRFNIAEENEFRESLEFTERTESGKEGVIDRAAVARYR
jgi:hypothetical protein